MRVADVNCTGRHVFAWLSRIQHSCRPNTTFRGDATIEVVALRRSDLRLPGQLERAHASRRWPPRLSRGSRLRVPVRAVCYRAAYERRRPRASRRFSVRRPRRPPGSRLPGCRPSVAANNTQTRPKAAVLAALCCDTFVAHPRLRPPRPRLVHLRFLVHHRVARRGRHRHCGRSDAPTSFHHEQSRLQTLIITAASPSPPRQVRAGK